MNHWKQTLLPLLLMFSSVLLDGFIASYWASTLDTNIGLVVPRIILLILIILSFHYKESFMLGSAAAFGFMMDAYYLGFLGVYMVSFMLVVTIVSNLKQIIQPNVLSYTLVSILGITAAELVVYGLMRILSITTISFQVFVVSRLSATLLFNGLAMLLFSYFIHRLVVNTLSESENR